MLTLIIWIPIQGHHAAVNPTLNNGSRIKTPFRGPGLCLGQSCRLHPIRGDDRLIGAQTEFTAATATFSNLMKLLASVPLEMCIHISYDLMAVFVRKGCLCTACTLGTVCSRSLLCCYFSTYIKSNQLKRSRTLLFIINIS